MLTDESLYHDQTFFDQLFCWSKQRIAHALPNDRDRCWGGLFLGFSLLFSGIAVYYLVSGLQQDSQASLTAHLISAILLGVVTRHFQQIGLRLLVPRQTLKTSNHKPTLNTKDTLRASSAERASAIPVTSPRQFFKGIRDAGVNVKIARALYISGIQSAKILHAKSDSDLLTIPGVGSVTVRKLRRHFNFVETHYDV